MIKYIWVFLCALLCTLVLAVRPAAAQSPILIVDPNDSPLIIHGTLDGHTSTFSGNLRFTARGGIVSELQLLASDVRHTTNPALVIDRSQVTIPANIILPDGQPRDVRVSVANVTEAGVYTGTVKLLLPSQQETNALV